MPTALTLDELEMESAELLPSRETLNRCGGPHPSYGHGGGGDVQFGLVNVDHTNINILSLVGFQSA